MQDGVTGRACFRNTVAKECGYKAERAQDASKKMKRGRTMKFSRFLICALAMAVLCLGGKARAAEEPAAISFASSL